MASFVSPDSALLGGREELTIFSWNYNMKEDPISEIDIIEGLGWQKDNMVSLHTGNNCSFQPGWETGKDFRAQCGLYANITHDG